MPARSPAAAWVSVPDVQAPVCSTWLRLISAISACRTKIPLTSAANVAPKSVMVLSRTTRLSTSGTQIAPYPKVVLPGGRDRAEQGARDFVAGDGEVLDADDFQRLLKVEEPDRANAAQPHVPDAVAIDLDVAQQAAGSEGLPGRTGGRQVKRAGSAAVVFLDGEDADQRAALAPVRVEEQRGCRG